MAGILFITLPFIAEGNGCITGIDQWSGNFAQICSGNWTGNCLVGVDVYTGNLAQICQ